jgi:hypothetical protein
MLRPYKYKNQARTRFLYDCFVTRACLREGSTESTIRYGFLVFGSAFSFLGSADSGL